MQHKNATQNTKHYKNIIKLRKEFTMTIKEMKDFFENYKQNVIVREYLENSDIA